MTLHLPFIAAYKRMRAAPLRFTLLCGLQGVFLLLGAGFIVWYVLKLLIALQAAALPLEQVGSLESAQAFLPILGELQSLLVTFSMFLGAVFFLSVASLWIVSLKEKKSLQRVGFIFLLSFVYAAIVVSLFSFVPELFSSIFILLLFVGYYFFLAAYLTSTPKEYLKVLQKAPLLVTYIVSLVTLALLGGGLALALQAQSGLVSFLLFVVLVILLVYFRYAHIEAVA